MPSIRIAYGFLSDLVIPMLYVGKVWWVGVHVNDIRAVGGPYTAEWVACSIIWVDWMPPRVCAINRTMRKGIIGHGLHIFFFRHYPKRTWTLLDDEKGRRRWRRIDSHGSRGLFTQRSDLTSVFIGLFESRAFPTAFSTSADPWKFLARSAGVRWSGWTGKAPETALAHGVRWKAKSGQRSGAEKRIVKWTRRVWWAGCQRGLDEARDWGGDGGRWGKNGWMTAELSKYGGTYKQYRPVPRRKGTLPGTHTGLPPLHVHAE